MLKPVVIFSMCDIWLQTSIVVFKLGKLYEVVKYSCFANFNRLKYASIPDLIVNVFKYCDLVGRALVVQHGRAFYETYILWVPTVLLHTLLIRYTYFYALNSQLKCLISGLRTISPYVISLLKKHCTFIM